MFCNSETKGSESEDEYFLHYCTSLSIYNTPSRWSISCWTITLASPERRSVFSCIFSSKYRSFISLCRATKPFFVFGRERHHSSTLLIVLSEASMISGLSIITVRKLSSSQLCMRLTIIILFVTPTCGAARPTQA